ncbi:carboxymuconolactone decarboxylase family protein [uncultured Jatrophihabitans sp.]|uniref:carboxymuconolactone decarboxylase family protein n=1 Tax=uncultured Jatrophihabitans sp. TaxID=1610747 RepID=UPI0035CA65A8
MAAAQAGNRLGRLEVVVLVREAPRSDERERVYDADRHESGYVDNLTRVWSWRPDVFSGFTVLRDQLQERWSLTALDRAVLVVSTAAARGDSYCSLAWGARLAELLDDTTVADLILGSDEQLDERSRALSAWASKVVRDPNTTTAADAERLRAAGLDDRAIAEATMFVGFRLAFSTVNDALGAQPDAQLAANVPAAIRDAVTYGRPPSTVPST